MVENLGRLFEAATTRGLITAISPHYYYPHDHGSKFEGPLEVLVHKIRMFERNGPRDLNGFDGSGADYMPEFKPFIERNDTLIEASPHKVYGPSNNDLVLQLRRAGVDQVILAGMSDNLCVQAHMHELLEQGFEVAVVRDATAGTKSPEGDGYLAVLIKFRFMANALWTTREAVERIRAA